MDIYIGYVGGFYVGGIRNEEQIITDYPIDGAMGSSGGGRFRKLSMICFT